MSIRTDKELNQRQNNNFHMGKLPSRSSIRLHQDCMQPACWGKNLDYWLGNLLLVVRDMVGDGQQGNQGGPSAAALEEDNILLAEIDNLQVAVIGILQVDASGNQKAVEGNRGHLAQVVLADGPLLCSCNDFKSKIDI